MFGRNQYDSVKRINPSVKNKFKIKKKTVMAKQNLWSWSLDTSPPSPQISHFSFLLTLCCLFVLSRFSRLFATPWTVARTRLLCPWDSPDKNTGVAWHFLLQGIFLTCLLLWKVRSLPLAPPGKLASLIIGFWSASSQNLGSITKQPIFCWVAPLPLEMKDRCHRNLETVLGTL